jgi:hypothetical protein
MSLNYYYELGTPYRTTTGRIHDTYTKTIASGVGDVELFRFTPGLIGDVTPNLLVIWGYAFTDLGGPESANISHFSSRFYVINRGGTLTIVPSIDEVVSSEFTLAINGLDCVLSISRHATLPRQVTTIADIYVGDGTTLTAQSLMSTDL